MTSKTDFAVMSYLHNYVNTGDCKKKIVYIKKETKLVH